MKRAWLPVIGVLTAGCGGGDARPAVTRVDSAGVEIVTYDGPDVTLAWTFDSLFALGGSDEGEDSFYAVRGRVVRADAAGNLYVLDASAKRIVVFDSAGVFVRAMGGPGGGPGEMEWPIALAVAPDGRAGAYDIAKRIPIIAEVAAGPDDTWWVRRRDAAGVDVYAADGAYLGTLPPSAPYPLVTLPGSRIAGIVTDELDVERLVIYRVRMTDP